jgi:flagellar hook protein FlgE
MGLSALGAGLSGLNANQQALAVEAHNVANLSTDDFQPQQAQFQESDPGVTLSVQGRDLARAENGTDLAKSTTNSMTYQAGFAMSLKVIQAADERIGMLIDIKA